MPAISNAVDASTPTDASSQLIAELVHHLNGPHMTVHHLMAVPVDGGFPADADDFRQDGVCRVLADAANAVEMPADAFAWIMARFTYGVQDSKRHAHRNPCTPPSMLPVLNGIESVEDEGHNHASEIAAHDAMTRALVGMSENELILIECLIDRHSIEQIGAVLGIKRAAVFARIQCLREKITAALFD